MALQQAATHLTFGGQTHGNQGQPPFGTHPAGNALGPWNGHNGPPPQPFNHYGVVPTVHAHFPNHVFPNQQPINNATAPVNFIGGDVDDEEDPEVQQAILESIKQSRYDPTPEGLTLTLLTLNVNLCLEISTILYEEYTFNVNIYSDGVEFLHFARIPTLENWGLEIENTLNAFKTKGLFCFQRMKHLNFVFFGKDPTNRLAALRMRESMRKLITFLKREESPVCDITVSFEYEPKDLKKEADRSNCLEDENGAAFWSNKAKDIGPVKAFTPRESILHDVFNIQLVCAPLKLLRKIQNVIKFQFPGEMRDNQVLKAYGDEISALVMSEDMTDEDQLDIMREDMLMDARRDKEMIEAGAGGYFHPPQNVVGEMGDYLPEPRQLLNERDIEDDNLEGLLAFASQAPPARGHSEEPGLVLLDLEMVVDRELEEDDSEDYSDYMVEEEDGVYQPTHLQHAASANDSDNLFQELNTGFEGRDDRPRGFVWVAEHDDVEMESGH